MYKNKNGGFSLLELIVVIAIMAVLGGIVIGNSNYSKSAQVKKYTELTDGFMRKARTEIMKKDDWPEDPRIPKGYYLDKDSLVNGVNKMGYRYQYYRMIKIGWKKPSYI